MVRRGSVFVSVPLLVGRPVIGKYLHSKFPHLIGIDIVRDGYMWVEWGSDFVIEGR